MSIQIIAGKHKGRKLLPPPNEAITRPITGLAKKSLFDTLAPMLDGAIVADLYCGTGTMGLEAISRGAAKCFFAELDRKVIERLNRNIQDCREQSAAIVWSGNVEARLVDWLAHAAVKFDLVFIDPPYADSRKWDWAKMVEKIFAPICSVLNDDGWVVLRVPAGVEVPPSLATLECKREKSYGDMRVMMLARS